MPTELEDFSQEPDGDLVRETYAYFGLAMYHAQVLEHGIVNAMVPVATLNGPNPSREELDRNFERFFSLTFGTLVRLLQQLVQLDDTTKDLLRQATAKRNYLAHNFFREHSLSFRTKAGCLKMIKDLENCHQLFEKTDKSLESPQYQPWVKLFGGPKAFQDSVDKALKEQEEEAKSIVATMIKF